MPIHNSHKSQIYQHTSDTSLLYALAFSAFIFTLIGGSTITLILWEQAVIQSVYAHNEFYRLLTPTKYLLCISMLVVFLLCTLVVRISATLLVERNRNTLSLLVLIGASDDYIINSFYRRTFAANLRAILLGAVCGWILMWGASFYVQYIFANTYSLLPGVQAIGSWYLLLLFLTVPVFGVMMMFGIRGGVRKFLHQNL